jgi:hypothetical protein
MLLRLGQSQGMVAGKGRGVVWMRERMREHMPAPPPTMPGWSSDDVGSRPARPPPRSPGPGMTGRSS